MTIQQFDFAPLLPAGLPAPAARWTGLAKYSFVGGNNDPEQVPVDGLIEAANCGAQARGQARSRPMGSPTVRRATGPCANSSSTEAQARRRHRLHRRRHPDRLRLAAGARPRQRHAAGARRYRDLIEQDSYQGSLNRLDPARRQRGRHPARRRRHAHGCAGGRARRPQAPRHQAEIHLHHPDGAEPDRHASCRRRAAPSCCGCRQQYGVPIFEDDCYADLIWNGERPPAIYAMSKNGGVIHIGSFSKSIAPALRVGFIVAPWDVMSRMLALKTDAGSGALEQMVLAEYCAPHFATHVPKLTRGAARQARHADGSARTSSSARRRSSTIPRAASSCGSSCPTMSTR